jgi:hypothetical protein
MTKEYHKQYNKEYHKNNFDYFKSRDLKKKFGITIEDYNKLFKNQNGLCAICNKSEISKHQSGTIRTLSVDHNHETGKVRGLLCSTCNRAIGLLKDNSILLLKASNYLEEI